ARFTSETAEDGALTSTGQVMGTPDFIAPEQARDTRAADIRADIFSLGCTLFFLLTGKMPFGGKSVMEKLAARLAEFPCLPAVRPDVPTSLAAVVAKMMAGDPSTRYQTPLDAALALAPFTQLPERAVVQAAPAGPPADVADTSTQASRTSPNLAP